MSTVKLLTSVFAIAAMAATSAMAGGWPNIPAKKVAASSADCCSVSAKNEKATNSQSSKTTRLISPDGFEYLGGEAGWQLAQHKYEYRNGRFTHAPDCPVSIAKAGGNLAPTAPALGA